MSKKMLCLLALVALVTFSSFTFAASQSPAKTAREQGPNTVLPPDVSCAHCFAYGGDIDPNSPNANGLASEKDVIVSDAEIVFAVVIPSGHSASMRRVVGNFLTFGCVIDPAQADWDVRQGVSNGNGGTVVASGTNAAVIAPTGRSAFGLTECHVETKLPSPVTLNAGTYFLGIVPYCTGGNSLCPSQRYYLSDSPDQPPINPKGNVPGNDSFFNSGFFGTNWQPTWGASGACAGVGCNRFSAGATGTVE